MEEKEPRPSFLCSAQKMNSLDGHGICAKDACSKTQRGKDGCTEEEQMVFGRLAENGSCLESILFSL